MLHSLCFNIIGNHVVVRDDLLRGMLVGSDLISVKIFCSLGVKTAHIVDLRLILYRHGLMAHGDIDSGIIKNVHLNCRLHAVSLYFFS